ncbi:MAG: FYDLN acid domain-containing protein [Maricaulaceae bacterium]
MAKVDLGTKRFCPECSAKFYDLARVPATCPECQHSFDPEELLAAAEGIAAMKANEDIKDFDKDEDDDAEETGAAKEEVDEDDIDEAEAEAKELELDGDDNAVIGSKDDGGRTDDYDGFSTDEDEDEDAALVADDDDNELPPPDADDSDDDDVEEIEI